MDQRQCNKCVKKDSCQEIYRQIGRSRAGPVTVKVLQAFVLPLVIFIVVLAATERLLTEKVAGEKLRIMLDIAAAVVAVSVYLVVTVLVRIWRAGD